MAAKTKFNFYYAPDTLFGGLRIHVEHLDGDKIVGFSPDVKKRYLADYVRWASRNYGAEEISLVSDPVRENAIQMPESELEGLAARLKEEVPNMAFVLG